MTYPNIALDTITTAQSQKEVTANNMAEAESPAALFGCRSSTTSGLTFGYYGGVMFVDGAVTAVASGTVLLTASNTNYVEATRAGVVSKNTTGFTAGSIPLYTIVTGTSTVSTVTPARAYVDPKYITHQTSVSITTADVTLTAAQARCNIILLSGTLTGNRNLIVPNNGLWVVDDDTAGAFSVTVKTSAGTGVSTTQGSAGIFFADGTNVSSAASGGGSTNSFSTIAVSGQSDVVADSSTDTLTLAAGSGISITTNATTDTITITNSGTASNSFETIAVSGQSDVVADSGTDTLTLAAGSGISITTNAGTDTITISASGGGSGLTLATAQAATSGTTITFSSLPAGLNRITCMWTGLSSNGTSSTGIRLGDAGGVETTGYTGRVGYLAGTSPNVYTLSTGFDWLTGTSSDTGDGQLILSRIDGNTWIASGFFTLPSNTVIYHMNAFKTLSAELTQVQFYTVNGTDTFDAGTVNINYE
jgi:hypothetical protein